MKESFDPHRYALALQESTFTSDGHDLYQWNGTFWQALEEHAAKRLAYHWLVKNDRNFASDANARAAHKASLLWVGELPHATRKTVIPCQNGYVTINDGQCSLIEPAPEFGLRHELRCRFEPEAVAPRFYQFLAEILPDKEVRERVQEYAGYTLLGDTRFQRAQFWIGQGANGKGTLANIIQALHNRTAAVQLDDLGGFRTSALLGASLIYCDEAPRGRINEPLVKTLIAGEPCFVDRKYLSPLSTRIFGKWLVLGNSIPSIKDATYGFWRRWDFVPFSQIIPPGRCDPLLATNIIEHELSGVLNWALAGLTRLLARGRFEEGLPQAMQALLGEAKTETNSVRAWFEDCSISFSGVPSVATKDQVYQHYRSWSERNGLDALPAPQFWTRLRDVGELVEVRKRHGQQQVRWCNVLLPGETA